MDANPDPHPRPYYLYSCIAVAPIEMPYEAEA